MSMDYVQREMHVCVGSGKEWRAQGSEEREREGERERERERVML